MAKVIAGVVATLILCILVGIVLVAFGKFLLGLAFVVGMLLITGLVIAGIFGKKFAEFWKSF